MTAPVHWLLPLLVCPCCRGPLELSGGPEDGFLQHSWGRCEERYPLIDGIPRLLRGAHRARLVRERASWFAADEVRRALGSRWSSETSSWGDLVVAGFDHEWRRFPAAGRAELHVIAQQYFDVVPDRFFDGRQLVLDAGCGSGRWAYEIATRGPRVVAMDLGLSIEIAKRNTAVTGRVAWVQADLDDMPLSDGAVKWAYSLGVIHHMVDPASALSKIALTVAPGGRVLVYVYYALDDRGRTYRMLYRASDLVRRMVSRSPRWFASAFASAVAITVYLPLARASALARWLGLEGLSRALPLSFYRELSLEVMRNDSLDRFGTRVEARYTRDGLVTLMRSAGLQDISVSVGAPYWHAIGTVAGRKSTE